MGSLPDMGATAKCEEREQHRSESNTTPAGLGVELGSRRWNQAIHDLSQV
jgi:hypothetical protein